MIISGFGFNFPLGPIADVSGILTGVLADGTAINVDFGRASGAQIVLVAVTDSDGDGIADGLDNCLDVQNPSQVDTDGNGLGDACNDAEDFDGDEFADNLDNCPGDSNGDQLDSDLDLIGDVCDPFPDDRDNEQAQCDADLTDALADLDLCLRPQCSDGLDNDGDCRIDWPDDRQCKSADEDSELRPFQ